MPAYDYLTSPIGLVEIEATDDALTAIRFVEQRRDDARGNALTEVAAEQLTAYFAGERRPFDLPLAPSGTPFQHSVWDALDTIPLGQTRTYQEIARALNTPLGAQAIGAANGQNPLAIVVPCHRVLGKDGSLTGYASGLWRKAWLLRHEGALLL